MPEIEGRVSAVIAESGGRQLLAPQKVAEEVGASFANVLNCTDSDVSLHVQFIRRQLSSANSMHSYPVNI